MIKKVGLIVISVLLLSSTIIKSEIISGERLAHTTIHLLNNFVAAGVTIAAHNDPEYETVGVGTARVAGASTALSCIITAFNSCSVQQYYSKDPVGSWYRGLSIITSGITSSLITHYLQLNDYSYSTSITAGTVFGTATATVMDKLLENCFKKPSPDSKS